MAMNSFKKMIMMANQAPKKQNRVFWNQGVNGCIDAKSTFLESDGYGYIADDTFNRIRFLYNGIYSDNKGSIDVSHIYAIHRKIATKNDVYKIYWYALSSSQSVIQDKDYEDFYIKSTKLYDRPSLLQFRDENDNLTSWAGYIECQIYDLTLMFGAGNEPTSVEEFYQRIKGIPVDIYAYNEGEWIEWDG